MNFGERKDPPHKGEKEVPEGAPDCLAGLTFVISGTLDSLEREEAGDVIKRYGGRVTGSISKKTNYLLADEDIGGVKSNKAKDLGVPFLTEDGLFDMIRKSKPAKAPSNKHENNSNSEKLQKSQTKSSPVKVEERAVEKVSTMDKSIASKSNKECAFTNDQKAKVVDRGSLQWTEKYRPKVPNDIVGNQSMVKQLHDWLKSWEDQFLHPGQKGKGKKQTDGGAKKAVLLSGPPGIGKTTTAKVVSQMLGLQAIEVNASDSRGKADSKIEKGVGGSTSNSVKELISNATLNYSDNRAKKPKAVLIMDEVDGMSAGDRGGVADLIASIKISKIPIVCICNDRYSQKLKSLLNYCLLLNFRKPTKQQVISCHICIKITYGKEALRLDYLTLLLRQLTGPLKTIPKDEAVQQVVEFMDTYCLSQEDFDTLVELSKFKGHPNPMDGIQPAVKSALTKAYKQGSSSRVIRSADQINIPGMRKTLKKRVAAILEPLDESLPEENGVASTEGDEDEASGSENDGMCFLLGQLMQSDKGFE
uniref:Uncharacterized protein n=1 Tax=Avena sativa TaxID=4498 RepID=A0ACD5UBJ4_AVESA